MKELIYNKKILSGVLAVVVALGLAGAGTMAYFRDTEEVGQNTITAGSLNLHVGENDPCTERIELSNLGGEYETIIWKIANTGSLPGKLSVEFSAITNKEEGCLEPEWNGAGDNRLSDEGELGEYLRVSMGWNASEEDGDKYFVPWNYLNKHGEQTYTAASVFEAGKTYDLYFRYDARQLVNIVQSDSVEFDILFHLEEAQ